MLNVNRPVDRGWQIKPHPVVTCTLKQVCKSSQRTWIAFIGSVNDFHLCVLMMLNRIVHYCDQLCCFHPGAEARCASRVPSHGLCHTHQGCVRDGGSCWVHGSQQSSWLSEAIPGNKDVKRASLSQQKHLFPHPPNTISYSETVFVDSE